MDSTVQSKGGRGELDGVDTDGQTCGDDNGEGGPAVLLRISERPDSILRETMDEEVHFNPLLIECDNYFMQLRRLVICESMKI